MSNLISREEAKKVLVNNGYGGNMLFDVIDSIPSADIMECARALKEHCNEHLRNPHNLCDDCPMFERACRRFNVVPRWWDLPEGEAKPNEPLIKDCCEAQGHLWADNNIFEDVEENQ